MVNNLDCIARYKTDIPLSETKENDIPPSSTTTDLDLREHSRSCHALDERGNDWSPKMREANT